MAEDSRTEPLRKWNRLTQENTENAIVSSMFEAMSKSTEPIEKFTTWLLVGTVTIASFFITNADKLLPVLKHNGFIACGAFLCLSCIFGLLSKMYALRCKIAIDTGTAIRQTFQEHFEKYVEEEKKINEGAKFWGINLQTGIRIERILVEFFESLPAWTAWFVSRHLKKNSENPQIGYLSLIKDLYKQTILTFIQSLFFFLFLVAGFIFTALV